ncbi:fasciclin-like arabinogalactan protein 21 [Rutidosis leptorrhynchoides]|uniref:fasciclin-like arabinogalactan protein 21 n=1 Tax=Rutidosis leptorrhynchoides TaxID=125765 RepID=UPI003A997DEB
MRGSLTDAVYRLRSNSDYTVLALLIQENLDMLSEQYSMTIFAVDDANLFGDGNTFVTNLRFHMVPNRRLIAVDLLNLPVDSELPTMVDGQRLVVTVAGGGGLLAPMRINNVKITTTDVVVNDGIVVHGIAAPFPRVSHTSSMGFWPDDHTDFINLGPIRLSETVL